MLNFQNAHICTRNVLSAAGDLGARECLISNENKTAYQICKKIIDCNSGQVFQGTVLVPLVQQFMRFIREQVFFDTCVEAVILVAEKSNYDDFEGLIDIQAQNVIERFENEKLVFTVAFYDENLLESTLQYQTLVYHGGLYECAVLNPYGLFENRPCLKSHDGVLAYTITHQICESTYGNIFGGLVLYSILTQPNSLTSGIAVKVLILEIPLTLNLQNVMTPMTEETITELMDSIGYRRYLSCRFEQIQTDVALYVVMPYIFGAEGDAISDPVIHSGEVKQINIQDITGYEQLYTCVLSHDSGVAYEFGGDICPDTIYGKIMIGGVLDGPISNHGTLGHVSIYRRPFPVKRVAFKIIMFDKVTGPSVENFSTEIGVMQELQQHGHAQHISNIIECIRTAKALYIVMNYLEGGDMYERIKLYRSRLSESPHLKSDFSNVVKALFDMSLLSLVHRDVSAENVLLDTAVTISTTTQTQSNAESGNTNQENILPSGKSVLCDFGQVVRVPISPTHTGMSIDVTWKTVFGKERYLPPEIYCPHGPYDAYKCDTWQLGILLFYMATGNFPLDMRTEDPAERYKYITNGLVREFALSINPTLSNELLDLICRMLQVDPQRRPLLRDVLDDPWLNGY